jgi:hypothetical protein
MGSWSVVFQGVFAGFMAAFFGFSGGFSDALRRRLYEADDFACFVLLDHDPGQVKPASILRMLSSHEGRRQPHGHGVEIY